MSARVIGSHMTVGFLAGAARDEHPHAPAAASRAELLAYGRLARRLARIP